MIDPEVSKQLDKILRNILWFCVKDDEFPCSAESHLDNAICDLLALLPEFETDRDEMIDKLDSAVKHMQLLGYKPAVFIEQGVDGDQND